jgi:peptidoglycan glycosyltransferase
MAPAVLGSLKNFTLLLLALVLPFGSAEAAEAKKLVARGIGGQEFLAFEQLVDTAKYDPKRDAYFVLLPDGHEAELTLDHRLQVSLERLLAAGRVAAGAIVMTEPRTGRVLALAGRNESGSLPSYALRAVAPAASVFKVVTSAALIEAGVDPDREVCFHGGKHRIEEKNLDDDTRRDNKCASLSMALGKSINLVFGKLASRLLTTKSLEQMASRFFFNQALPVFPRPRTDSDMMVSPARIPDKQHDRLDFGRTAAGFGQVRLSPLHGAVLAGTIANNGLAVAPRIIEAVWRDGKRDDLVPTRQERVVSEATAEKIVHMMERTVKEGTARKSFHVGRGLALGKITVAGKTGTLNDKETSRDNSWFIGFAPAEAPVVTVSALAVNGPKWKVRAAALARDALKAFFQVDSPRARRGVH